MNNSTQKINVLWIDDEHLTESSQLFVELANSEGIILNGYDSFEGGFEALEKDPSNFDAVLLDAMFFEARGQQKGSADLKGLGKAVARLNQLSSNYDLPFFILSGQTKLEKNDVFEETYGRHFRKGDDNDINLLFEAIRDAVDAKEDRRIQYLFPRVYEICSDQFLKRDSWQHLAPILKSITRQDPSFDHSLYFNQLRIILEHLFRLCHRRGLLPDACIDKGKVILQGSSMTLSGKAVPKLGIQERAAVFPEIVSVAVRRILEYCNEASHSDANGAGKQLEEFRRTVRSPYLLYSLTFDLMDVLLWLKDFLDHKADEWIKENPLPLMIPRNNPATDGWKSGKVTVIMPAGSGFFRPDDRSKDAYISKELVNKFRLVPEMRIIARVAPRHGESNDTVIELKMS